MINVFDFKKAKKFVNSLLSSNSSLVAELKHFRVFVKTFIYQFVDNGLFQMRTTNEGLGNVLRNRTNCLLTKCESAIKRISLATKLLRCHKRLRIPHA